MWKEGVRQLPEPAELFSCYTTEEGSGSMFSDNAAMATRIFELPSRGLQWVLEPVRTRLEDRRSLPPAESKLALEFTRIAEKLYPGANAVAYGFNYDIIYRMDSVVPAAEVMKSFVAPADIEDIKDFGWQYSLSKQKGKRIETYFFKAVSPIEYAVHANIHFNKLGLPKKEELQSEFEKEYAKLDEAVNRIAFN